MYAETGLIPEVNQIQLSPYATRPVSRAYHDERGIVTESWSPIGASNIELREDSVVTAIAADHARSATQIVLRWHLQLGLVAVPKSGNPGRIAENIDVFDFELTEDQMQQLSSLDRGEGEVTDSDQFGQ